MKSQLAGRLIGLVSCGLLLCGCSSVVNSHRQKSSMMEDYASGDHSDVVQKINDKLKEPKWYNSSVVNTGDEVMWRLEAGSMNFNAGNFAESVAQFKKAEELIAAYDDRAKVSARNVGAEASVFVTNLNALPYRGLCRDRIALSIYKSLAYLGSDNESAFRAQLRRLRGVQKKVQEEYREFFKEQQAELKAAKKKNPDAAKKADADGSEEKLKNDPKNAEFTAGLKVVRAVANKGYGHFLNPAALFLSGLGSVRDGNYDNARIDFKRMYEAMPNNPTFQRYYVTALQKASRPVPSELKAVKPFDFPLDHNCVYVLFANGKSAAFKQIAIYFPVMAAWPMCEFYPAPFGKLTARADGTDYPSELLADMDGILAQEFDERLPGIITRIVLSTLIKDGAYYGGMAAIWKSSMSPLAKGIVLAAVAIGGAIYRASVNTADTRSWEILPKEFQLTQFPMPKDRTVTVDLDRNGVKHEVKIPDDCDSAIVFVNAPSERSTSCRVLPIR